MSSPSAVPQLIDSLLTIFADAVSVPVIDGPVVDDSNRQGFVSVGWDGSKDANDIPDGGTVADIDQVWPHVGGFTKQEDGSIVCGAVASSGGYRDAYKPIRDLVFGYVSDCERALRAAFEDDGGLIGGVRYIDLRLATGSLTQEPITDGVLARVPFSVIYQTWI